MLHLAAFIFTFISFGLQAASPEAILRQSEVYYEAGDYEKARNEYELLNIPSLTEWQQAIIRYNLGTIYLAEGDLKKALESFKNALQGSEPLPALQQRLTANIALDRLLQANVLLEKMKSPPAKGSDDYRELIYSYRTVLQEIDAASLAACALQRAEGAQSCSPWLDIEQMDAIAKQNLAIALQHYHTYKFAHMQVQEGLALLIASEQSIKDNEKNTYQTNYLSEATSWEQLWKVLFVELQKKQSQSQTDILKILQQAYQEHQEALSQLQKKEYYGGSQHLENSIEKLTEALQAFVKERSLSSAMRELSLNYDDVLIEDPMESVPLNGLMIAQNALSNIFENAAPFVKDGLTQAQKNLKRANQLYQENKFIESRMWVDMGGNVIRMVQRELMKTQKNEIEIILQNLIDAQELAIRLNQLMKNGAVSEAFSLDSKRLPKKTQEALLEMIPTFMPAASKQQKVDYEEKKARPWEEIITLFLAGKQAALQAHDEIFANKIEASMLLQEKAEESWKEALEKLRQASSQESASEPTTSEQSLGKPQPPAKESSTDILRMLQEMENDDRSQLEINKVPNYQEVERPW